MDDAALTQVPRRRVEKIRAVGELAHAEVAVVADQAADPARCVVVVDAQRPGRPTLRATDRAPVALGLEQIVVLLLS
jgi:hypothetical protein